MQSVIGMAIDFVTTRIEYPECRQNNHTYNTYWNDVNGKIGYKITIIINWLS